MLSIFLDLLMVPGAKLYVLLILLLRSVRPILRRVSTLSGPPKSPFLALPSYTIYEYVPLRLDPPSATRVARRASFSTRSTALQVPPSTFSTSLRAGTHRGSDTSSTGVPTPLVAALLVALVMLLGIVITALDLFRDDDDDDDDEFEAPHVAEVYTSLTGRPYASCPWEWALVYQPPSSPSPKRGSDTALVPDIIIDRSLDSTLEAESHRTVKRPPSLEYRRRTTALEPGPSFVRVINAMAIDEYMKALTDAGYSQFEYRILDMNDLNPNNIVVEWELSAKSAYMDVFMDATLRCMPLSAIPPTHPELILWDMGGGRFKALELLEIAVSTKDRVDGVFVEGEEDYVVAETSFAGRDSSMDIDMDSDNSVESLFRSSTRVPSFEHSPSEISTDSDGYDDSLRHESSDSDASASCSPDGRWRPPPARTHSSPRSFPLSSTPRTAVFKST